MVLFAMTARSIAGPQRAALRTPEAAAYVGLSASTMNKLRLTGDGPKFCRLGRAVVYLVVELDSWLSTRVRTSTSDEGCADD